MQPVVFIARLVGPLFVVLGLGCLINQQVYADMIGQAVLVPVLISLSGIMTFTAGVATLNGYCAWTADWRVIITIFGWLLVIAGVIRIALPTVAAVTAMSVYSGPFAVMIVGIVLLIIGAYLSFEGYRAKSR
jgi:hypothetical protein